MRESAYNYFKTLFEKSSEFIVCIDDKQNIVYATDKVFPAFCTDDSPILHLSSIISQRQCNRVEAASKEPVHSVSFDFISPLENAPRRCVVIPTLFEGIYYYILHISNTRLNGIDKLQRQDMETIIDVAASEIANSTIPIIEIAQTFPEDACNEISLNVQRIRKVFGNIENIATNHTTMSECRVVELHEYILNLLKRYGKRLGDKRFKYILLPSIRVAMTKISLEALDIMATNLINEILFRANKSALVYVMICSDSANNYIIVSNTDNGLAYHTSELISQSDSEKIEISNNRIIAARTVVSKIARDVGGKAFFTKTFGGGVTNGIMLKKSKARISTLREQSLDSTKRSERLDILLSDI